MIRITIPFFRPTEEELAGGVQKLSDLKMLVDKTVERLSKVVKVLKILEKNGWKWETSYHDIIVFKPHLFVTTKKDAEKELKKMKVDRTLIEIETV